MEIMSSSAEYETTRTSRIGPGTRGSLRTHYTRIEVQTERQNLTALDPRLSEFLEPSDFFYIQDVTSELHRVVLESGVRNGVLTVQILHTSATLVVNEIDEPMLLGDLMRKVRAFAPK